MLNFAFGGIASQSSAGQFATAFRALPQDSERFASFKDHVAAQEHSRVEGKTIRRELGLLNILSLL